MSSQYSFLNNQKPTSNQFNNCNQPSSTMPRTSAKKNKKDAPDVKLETPPSKAAKNAKSSTPGTSPNSANASPVSVATNLGSDMAAEKKPDVSTFTVFCVTNKGPTVCASKEEADAFRMDWGDYVAQEKKFSSQGEVDAFVSTQRKPSPATTPVKPIVDMLTPAPGPPGSMERYAKSVKAIHKNQANNRLYARHKTNGASTGCLVLLEPVNYSGKAQWNFKPELVTVALETMISDFADDAVCIPILEDPIYLELVKGMKHLRIRDPNGTPATPLQVTWTSPDKAKTIAYDQFTLATHFTIPVKEIKSEAMETVFITSKLEGFITAFKELLLSPAFAILHEAACPKASVWAAMNGLGPKTGGLTFQGYIKDAAPTVEKCTNLNTYIVHDDTTDLMNVLWNGRINDGEQKYKN